MKQIKQNFYAILLSTAIATGLYFVFLVVPDVIEGNMECYNTYAEIKASIKTDPVAYGGYKKLYDKSTADLFLSSQECYEMNEMINNAYKRNLLK